MVINNLNTIYPAKQSWPDAIISLKDISLDTKDLRLPAGVKHLEYIRKLVKLERLWCFNINESSLEYISNCESLKCLYIENLKTNNIVNLQKLKLLKTLSINTCSKIISSQAYNKFEHLQELAIIHFKNLHEIESISVLMSLKALVISGSMWSVMKY